MVLPGMTIDIDKVENKNLPVRYGTPIEKNVEISEEKMIKLEHQIQDRMAFYTAYPDLWLEEVLLPTNSSFRTMFYQRLMMRQMARIPVNHMTGARGLSKTFTILFMKFHRCIFYPGITVAFAAPGKSQSAQIGKQTVNDILNRFPLLKNELDGDVVGGKDYFEVRFKNGSKIEITAALDSTRGRRFDDIAVDEARRLIAC